MDRLTGFLNPEPIPQCPQGTSVLKRERDAWWAQRFSVLMDKEYLAVSHHTWSLHQSPEAGSQNTDSFKSFFVSILSKNDTELFGVE